MEILKQPLFSLPQRPKVVSQTSDTWREREMTWALRDMNSKHNSGSASLIFTFSAKKKWEPVIKNTAFGVKYARVSVRALLNTWIYMVK